MKIYNKKGFAAGVFMAVLATADIIAGCVRNTLDLSKLVVPAVLYAFALNTMLHSLSRKRAKQDKLDAWDERNQLIALKSKSKAFSLTQAISLVLMLALLAMGKVSNDSGFIAMGVGLAFAFVLSMFAEFLTYLYYESKN